MSTPTTRYVEGAKIRWMRTPIRPDGSGQVYGVAHREGVRGHGVKSITVVMEKGPAGEMPWALVVQHNGEENLINLSFMEVVDMEPGT